LLVQEERLEPCFAQAQRRLVGVSSRGNWFLVEGSPIAACTARGNAHRTFTYTP
jgi:hypothetical protein